MSHEKDIRLHPGQHPGTKRGPAVDRPAGGRGAGPKYLSGQAVREGLPAAPVPAAGAEDQKGRPSLCEEHRPPGAQLRRDPGAVAAAHQGAGGGHCGAGHAPAGHQTGQGPDGHLSQRRGAPGAVLRGGERAGQHPPAPG